MPSPVLVGPLADACYVGETESQLTESSVPCEVGISRYRELARGQICADSYGVLKLLVSVAALDVTNKLRVVERLRH